jgi:glycosyltransferase involved in cell wall biosynthesis
VECRIIVPRDIGDGSLIGELTSRGLFVERLPYTWWATRGSVLWKRAARTLLNILKSVAIAKQIRRWQCDIVYTNTATICVGAVAAKLLKLPHVWHIHEFGYEDHGLIFDLGERFSLRFMDRYSSVCIVNSEAVAHKYRRHISPAKIKIIYQSVNITRHAISELRSLFRLRYARIRCVIVGTLQEGKGQADAIRAIHQLLRIGIESELIIVGDGDKHYRDYLHELVRERKLEKHIRLVGFKEDPFPFMQAADVVLMCSRNEAFGRVTVEALKLGKPVIGARSGGTTELLHDGFNGLLYTPGDYMDMAEKIEYLCKKPYLRRKFGENGRRWATKRFTRDLYGERILKILRQIDSGKINHNSNIGSFSVRQCKRTC